tara:strand:- start:35 stop:457 length:423 start_codon:yes stop_codon:yes gene_type:complete
MKIKDNYTKLNRYLNIKGPKSAVYTFTPEHLPDVPWNKDKTGLQEGHGKGGNRPDLSKEARKRIALKTIAYRTGKKHTKETKRKIASKATGRARPDMIGNKLSFGDRDNSIFRTPAFRAMSRARANKRWAVVSNCRQLYA